MKNYFFDKGPLIYLDIITDKELIVKVTIKLSKIFSASITPCSTVLKKNILTWLELYSNKLKHSTPFFLNVPTGTLFQENTYQNLLQVPFGKTLSYLNLAQKALAPKASRAVGTLCKNNPIPFFIPCHRVLKKDCYLGQYNGGVEIKKRLLTFEGAFYK